MGVTDLDCRTYSSLAEGTMRSRTRCSSGDCDDQLDQFADRLLDKPSLSFGNSIKTQRNHPENEKLLEIVETRCESNPHLDHCSDRCWGPGAFCHQLPHNLSELVLATLGFVPILESSRGAA